MESVENQPEKLNTEENEIKVADEKLEQFIQEAKYEQNLSAAILGGLIAAIMGAIVWALITAAIKVQIGWMAVGIGFLVGIVVRTFGKGFDPIFGFIGAGLSLFGCLLGNLLTIVILISLEYDASFLEILTSLEIDIIANLMKETFDVMDLVFYGIAIYEGYKFSIRQITEKEINQMAEETTL